MADLTGATVTQAVKPESLLTLGFYGATGRNAKGWFTVACIHERGQKYGKTKCGEQRYRCCDCGKTYVESTKTLDGMRIGTDRAAQIVAMLCEGMSVRATCRLTGASPETVLDTLTLIGERCRLFCEGTIKSVPVKDVQVDELWAFVGMKEKTRKSMGRPYGSCGDQYCFVGLESYTKLVLAWHMGDRIHENGWAFCRKLAHACQPGAFQVSSDGWSPYKRLIPNMLPGADYGMIIKIFSTKRDDLVRYSPGQIIEIKRKPIAGNPDLKSLNTSYVERHNLSMRMGIRRLTRLTNAFSRKLANHKAALGLYFGVYNFCQRHGTIKTTPAVASGLADHQWTVAELIERTANYDPPAPEWESYLGSIPTNT